MFYVHLNSLKWSLNFSTFALFMGIFLFTYIATRFFRGSERPNVLRRSFGESFLNASIFSISASAALVVHFKGSEFDILWVRVLFISIFLLAIPHYIFSSFVSRAIISEEGVERIFAFGFRRRLSWSDISGVGFVHGEIKISAKKESEKPILIPINWVNTDVLFDKAKLYNVMLLNAH